MMAVGWTPDPRQIGPGDGGGDGPPIPGKSGMAAGMGIGGSVPWGGGLYSGSVHSDQYTLRLAVSKSLTRSVFNLIE